VVTGLVPSAVILRRRARVVVGYEGEPCGDAPAPPGLMRQSDHVGALSLATAPGGKRGQPLRRPGATRYLVSQQVTWGYIKVGIAQSASSSRHIEARLISSELELLP
jgi:hypothetical protein